MTLTKTDVGLANVDNTSDLNKPVSTAQAAADATKASIAGQVFTGAISATNLSGTNTGDETTATIKTKLGITTLSGSNTGDQTNITGTAGTITGSITESQVTNLVTDLAAKQATLVSGTNIKTVNGTSLLGAGNVVIAGGGSSTLAGDTDVAIASPADKDILTYSTSAGKWQNAPAGTTTVPDATTTSKGIIELAGDLAGTAAAPTVPGLASKANAASPALTGTVGITGTSGTMSLYSNPDGGEYNIGASASGALAFFGTGANTLNVNLLDGSLSTNSTTRLTNAGQLQNTDLTGTGNIFPTFNQNTTGTAANITGTLAVAQGGTGATANTGTGSNVLSTSPSLTTPKADFINDTSGGKEIELVTTASSANWVKLTNTITGSGVTIGVNGTGTNENLSLAAMGTGTVQVAGSQVTTAANTQTLTNKTLTAPVISTITNTGTLTLPTTTGTVALTSSNITGTAANVTGTVAIANGGTGVATLPTGILKGAGTSAITAVTAPTGAIVGTTDTQTLSGKTFSDFLQVAGSASAPATPASGFGKLVMAGTTTVRPKFINSSATLETILTDASVTRQDNTTNSGTMAGVRIETGWGFATSAGSVTTLSKTVTFNTAFNSVPVIQVTFAGDTAAGTTLGSAGNNLVGKMCIKHHTDSTTSFIVKMDTGDGGNAGAGNYFFTWLAIGT